MVAGLIAFSPAAQPAFADHGGFSLFEGEAQGSGWVAFRFHHESGAFSTWLDVTSPSRPLHNVILLVHETEGPTDYLTYTATDQEKRVRVRQEVTPQHDVDVEYALHRGGGSWGLTTGLTVENLAPGTYTGILWTYAEGGDWSYSAAGKGALTSATRGDEVHVVTGDGFGSPTRSHVATTAAPVSVTTAGVAVNRGGTYGVNAENMIVGTFGGWAPYQTWDGERVASGPELLRVVDSAGTSRECPCNFLPGRATLAADTYEFRIDARANAAFRDDIVLTIADVKLPGET